MKHIKAAWIEQVLEFDSKDEVQQFIEELEQKKQRRGQQYDVTERIGTRIRVRKQYNNNKFPDQEGSEKDEV